MAVVKRNLEGNEDLLCVAPVASCDNILRASSGFSDGPHEALGGGALDRILYKTSGREAPDENRICSSHARHSDHPLHRHCAHYCQYAPSRNEHAPGDWSHLLVGVTRLLYRRLGLDACLLNVSLLRFLQNCLRVCAACSTLAVEF